MRQRVYEVAKQLGVTSKEVQEQLNRMGERVRSATSLLDATVIARLKSSYRTDQTTQAVERAGKSQASTPQQGRGLQPARTKRITGKTVAADRPASNPATGQLRPAKTGRSARHQDSRAQRRGKSRREQRETAVAISPTGPGKWHAQCPLCFRWVEVQNLWGIPESHRSCSPHDYVKPPERYAWLDPDIHGWRPPKDNIRWKPVGKHDPGMTYSAVLLAARSDIAVEFVEWARTAVTEVDALREAKDRTVPSLRRHIAQLEALPKRLVNPHTERRLRIAKLVLIKHDQAHEVALERPRQPRRALPKRITRIVSGGLPTLGRR